MEEEKEREKIGEKGEEERVDMRGGRGKNRRRDREMRTTESVERGSTEREYVAFYS